MNVDTHINGKGTKQILVSGNVEKKEEIDQLLRELYGHPYEEIHITFLDANILPAEIIHGLHQLLKENRCKVFVLKPYLYSYFYRLGIFCRHIAKKSIAKGMEPLRELEDERAFDPDKIGDFLLKIHQVYGYDYTQYQINSIIRRIKTCMIRENLKSFDEFQRLVLEDEGLFEQLFLDLSVNTTEFFRNPEVFYEMRKSVLPHLERLSHIKIWCAGCSTGQEPYSLAIMLEEAGILHKCQIYATDINPYVIGEAKNALFSLEGIETSIRNYRLYKGTRSLMGYFQLRADYLELDHRFKRNILFFQHNLIESGIFGEFDLILCRNVLIYFDTDLQSKILEKFHRALEPEGFLILGKSEGILHNGGHHLFHKYDKENKIYTNRAIGISQ